MKIIPTVLIPLFLLCLVNLTNAQNSATSQKNESELLKKIEAVQQQIMAQGNISEQEELAIASLCRILFPEDGPNTYDPVGKILLKDLENAPVYFGCETLSKVELKQCFKENVAAFIEREFNLKISKALNISEPGQVEAFFVIDESGNVSGTKVRAADITIQAELIRILEKMPKMKPASQNGTNVSVLVSIVVDYGDIVEVEVTHIPENLNND